MRISTFSLRALRLAVAAAILGGCGAQSGTVPQGSTTAQNAAHRASRVTRQSRPQALSGYSGDLLYAPVGYDLSIYSYPDLKRLKVVNTFPNGLGGWSDSDPNNGYVCLDNFYQVFIYEHGATSPFATITAPQGAETQDCAFDPATNNLAITYWENTPGLHSWVSVYEPPYDGTQTQYSDAGMHFMLYAAYDARGDLFVDGQDTRGCQCLYDELPKGSKTFLEFEDSQLGAQSLRWDGQYMTVSWPNVKYRFTVSGSKLTVVGKTAYEDATRYDGFQIYGKTAMGWTLHKGLQGKLRHIGFWRYPNGKKPFKIIKVFSRPKDLDWAAGIPVVSVAPSHK